MEESGNEAAEKQLELPLEIQQCPSVRALKQALHDDAHEILRHNFITTMVSGTWFIVHPNSASGSSSSASSATNKWELKRPQTASSMHQAIKPLWRYCRLGVTHKALCLSAELNEIPGRGELTLRGDDLPVTIELCKIKEVRVNSIPQNVLQQLGIHTTSQTILATMSPSSPSTATSGSNSGSPLKNSLVPSIECSGASPSSIAFLGADGEVLADFICTNSVTLRSWVDGMHSLLGLPMDNSEALVMIDRVVSASLYARLVGLPAAALSAPRKIPPLPEHLNFYYHDLGHDMPSAPATNDGVSAVVEASK